MCDYSLMHLPNRLAAEGETLVVHSFPGGSHGLASPADLVSKRRCISGGGISFWGKLKELLTLSDRCAIPAVCIPPGARLRLQDIGKRMRRDHGLECDEEVTFEQLTNAANTYRDAIVFKNGTKLLLQLLPEGQRVTILTMSSLEHEDPVLVSSEPARMTRW